jgi:hypothetical protein
MQEFTSLEFLFLSKMNDIEKNQEAYNYYQDFFSSKKLQNKNGSYNENNYTLGPSSLLMECDTHGSCTSCHMQFAANVCTKLDGQLFLDRALCCANSECGNCNEELGISLLSKRHTIYNEKINQDYFQREQVLQCWKMDTHTAFCGACLNHMIQYARNLDANNKINDDARVYAKKLAEALGKHTYLEQLGYVLTSEEEFQQIDERYWNTIDPQMLEKAFQSATFDLRSVKQIKAFKEYHEGKKLVNTDDERQYLEQPGKYIAVKIENDSPFALKYDSDQVGIFEEFVATLVNLCRAKMKRSTQHQLKQRYTNEMFQQSINERIDGLAGFGGEKSSAMVMLMLAYNGAKLYAGTYNDLLEECRQAAEGDDRLILLKNTDGQMLAKMKLLEEQNRELIQQVIILEEQLAHQLPKRRRKSPHAKLFETSSDESSSSSDDEESSDEESSNDGNKNDSEDDDDNKENNGFLNSSTDFF